jgi:hypothetical protein
LPGFLICLSSQLLKAKISLDVARTTMCKHR